MGQRIFWSILPLVIVVAVPLLLRPTGESNNHAAADELVIITPHNEAIRHEFELAFRTHYQKLTGRNVVIDWRTPGGTSQIVRYIDDQFVAAFRRFWLTDPARGPWTEKVAGSFNNDRIKLTTPGPPSLEMRARRLFLASKVGIGVDLFFGGGQYEMNKQARKGYAVDAGVQQRHPDWFRESIIPAHYSGETFYDAKGRYYGVCLSSFGICYNRDRIAQLPDSTTPDRWDSLGEPKFFGQLGIADPTKSGSITKCFEMLIQQKMAENNVPERPDAAKLAALSQGWQQAMTLIKQIGGNARTITDSAGKIPRDTGNGEFAAGMCIDFYGRTQADWTGYCSGGRERVVYIPPKGGSSISVDPIQLLRGAPHAKTAKIFIDFLLSSTGQKIWNYRPGTPGGPQIYALRRLPVRRDMYTPQDRKYMADATADPFGDAASFTYHGRWTGPYFSLIRNLIKCMVVDPLPELRRAWGAIVAAGGPDAVPEAMAEFEALPFDYPDCRQARNRLNPFAPGHSPLTVIETQREWTAFFRRHYRRAAELAERRKSATDRAHPGRQQKARRAQ